jgi:hypothetical protein
MADSTVGPGIQSKKDEILGFPFKITVCSPAAIL